jgi:hypothetical protein
MDAIKTALEHIQKTMPQTQEDHSRVYGVICNYMTQPYIVILIFAVVCEILKMFI